MHTSTQKVSSYLFESDRSKMTQHNFVMINENKNCNIIFYENAQKFAKTSQTMN